MSEGGEENVLLPREEIVSKKGHTSSKVVQLSSARTNTNKASLQNMSSTYSQQHITHNKPVSTLTVMTPCTRKSKRHQDITNAVTYSRAKDMKPVSVVEKEGFGKLKWSRVQLPGRDSPVVNVRS